MAKLFQRDRCVIGELVRNIFKESEFQEESVWAKFAYTAADGKVYDVLERFRKGVLPSGSGNPRHKHRLRPKGRNFGFVFLSVERSASKSSTAL